MKVLICNKLLPGDKDYFKLGWRIPFKELEKINWITIDQKEIITSINKFFHNKYGKIPKVIFFWNTNKLIKKNFDEILKNKWIKCIYFDDLHQNSKNVINYRKKIIKNFDYIFSTYAYTFKTFYPIFDPKKIIWLPHNINTDFKIELNKNPNNKILLSGCINSIIYPFRYYIYNLSKTEKYPIDVLKSLSYSYANHKIYGFEYIKYMNKYLACVTCCSYKQTPYIVSKFFEIPASGSLLLAYDEYVKESLEKLGFKDNENYISVNFKNIIEKIKYITDPNNKEVIDKIRENGYNLVWNNHTLKKRVELIDKITDMII